MTSGVIFSLALHNHQPVGNFPEVLERAYQQSYLPMVEAVERHEPIQIGLHYSGPLFDWFEEAHPEFFPRLRRLVTRGQVELLTGGYYEPILAIIPDRDKQGQIQKMTRYLQRQFGASPRGLWLAERVWEPHLAKPIAQSGVEYTIVDDAHFLAAGLREDELWSYFVTEEGGATLKVFASRRRLRYLIPWKSPAEVIAYLRKFEGTAATLLMGDDGEKFGLWPGTYAHCWEHGWVEAFFTALEAETAWLTLLPPGRASALAPAGRVYLPTASYDEMTEWALPAERAVEFVQAKERLEAGHDPAVAYLRGGYWRQFLVKYPEINTMHKKMLRVSDKVSTLPVGQRKQRAQDELWKGQGNCAYWHGVFGGIYLPHIRAANFAHLIAAEALADGGQRGAHGLISDFDSDGSMEVEVASPEMMLTIDPGDGGSVVEWDWRPRRINLVNVLTRRRESYHRQLQEAGAPTEVGTDGAVETIHSTRVRVKEQGLDQFLLYDWYRRSSFIDHVIVPATTLEDFYRSQYGEIGDFVNQAYTLRLVHRRGTVELVLVRDGKVWIGNDQRSLRIEKRFTLEEKRSQLTVAYRIMAMEGHAISIMLGVETNWALTDPGASIVANTDRGAAREKRAVETVTRIEFGEPGWGGTAALTLSRPGSVWVFPLEAVSNSEGGFERTFQGVTCLCQWPVHLAPQEPWEATLTTTLTAS